MAEHTVKKSVRVCGGTLHTVQHMSTATQTPMTYSLFLPPQAKEGKVPALYFLSGLTCNHENFVIKATAISHAARAGIALVCPDTSPRGAGIEGEDDDWDFGTGAGFYVNATTEKYSKHYNMYDYVTVELPALVETHFPVSDVRSVTGHSMGGHGALVCFLRNPGMYRSVSAFSPICNPMNCAWGKKALSNYLGPDEKQWLAYDATELVSSSPPVDATILIDQGTADDFLTKKQLLPEVFGEACKKAGQAVDLRMQEGYDHSYFFIQSFIGDHIEHHATALKKDIPDKESGDEKRRKQE